MSAESQNQEAALSREEIEHVAMLSRLTVSEAQVDEYAEVLNRILKHFRNLDELDTEGVEPTGHSVDVTSVMREDTARASLPKEDVLANVPNREGDRIRVKAVLDNTL